jgi:hypothetical protein
MTNPSPSDAAVKAAVETYMGHLVPTAQKAATAVLQTVRSTNKKSLRIN